MQDWPTQPGILLAGVSAQPHPPWSLLSAYNLPPTCPSPLPSKKWTMTFSRSSCPNSYSGNTLPVFLFCFFLLHEVQPQYLANIWMSTWVPRPELQPWTSGSVNKPGCFIYSPGLAVWTAIIALAKYSNKSPMSLWPRLYYTELP